MDCEYSFYNIDGLDIKYYKKDYIEKDLEISKGLQEEYGKFWNDSVVNIMKVILEKNDIFVDVGAHIGYLSLIASKIVGNTGKVYLFELQPDLYRDCILPNIFDNKISNIIPYNCAVGNTRSIVSFTKPELYGFNLDYLNYGQVQTKLKVEDTDVKVLCNPLDGMISEKVKLIKIDVQGMELEVLKGSKNIIRRHKPYIIIELEWYVKNYGSTNEEIINFLKELNYEIFLIESYWPTDFIAIHKSRLNEFEKKHSSMYGSKKSHRPYFLNVNMEKYPEQFKDVQYTLIKDMVTVNTHLKD
jgi:FkbM family methyltransferase